MKKSILLLVALTFMLYATILRCTIPTKNAQENVTEGNKDLSEANQEYLDEIEHYRKEKAITIESNSLSITHFKAKIDTKKEERKNDYRHSIFELELQNSYMKMKLDEYEPEGKEKWKIFKAEFTRQLDELSKEFTDFTKVI